MLKISKFSISLPEIPQRGTARLDRLGQDLSDDRNQGADTGGRDLSGLAARRHTGPKQCFTDIDIAQPRDDSLIEQGGFDRGVPALERRDQMRFVEIVAQRLGPENHQQLVFVRGRGRHQVHRPEPARVVEGDAGTIVHVKHHMVMFLRRRVVMHELPQRVA